MVRDTGPISKRLWFVLQYLRQAILRFREEKALKKANYVERVHGLFIFSGLQEDLTYPLLDRLHRALDLTLRDARAARRLHDYVRHVLIREGQISGFLKASRTIVLSHELLKGGTLEEIASVVVHETVHARINAFGVGTWSSRLPAVESRCLHEQMEFLERFPGTEHVLQHLRQYVGKTWWRPSDTE